MHYIGLDVGGTTMKSAVVDEHGKAFESVSLSTESQRGQEAGLQRMAETIRLAIAKANLTLDDITAIGVATPGLMDIKRGLILDPPNLKPWKDVPVPDYIRKEFNKPVAFQNDANAAALGEFWIGAGRDVHSMVLFTLGTGIGGGIIIDERIIEGDNSHAGEIGHVRIALPEQGRLCGCGRRGCLEAYASATAVVARTREAMAGGPIQTSLRKFVREDEENEISSKEIFDAAEQGDELAGKIVEETAYYLALGACSVMNTVDPEMIVFGGGMVAAGEPFLKRIQAYVLRYGLDYPASRATIRFAQLGSDAGFIGAAGCAKRLTA